MKRHPLSIAIAMALGVVLGVPGVALGETIELRSGFETETLSGTSGGSQPSDDCGSIAATPNHELQLAEDFSYLRISISGGGNPTLLVVGPESSDRFCARNTPQQSGYLQQGTYYIYVGDRNGEAHPYTLSISEIP
ncbi:hypothetical protein [Baaleninema sp.]|uniref:hypothetical protein n=1 Tax=Baaleninema sp. TaxID=3101197 RepID=UPI003CFBD9E8